MAKKREPSVLTEGWDALQHILAARPGNEVPKAVQDVMDVVFGEDGLQPIVIKKTRKGNQWTFVLSLPAGIPYSYFYKLQEVLSDATHGTVLLEKLRKVVIMRIAAEPLRGNYPFKWDWEQYKEMALPVHFGFSGAGPIVRDLAESPNILIGGTPGSGKSNLLHVLLACILLARGDNVIPIIVDRKRLEFSYLARRAIVVTELGEAKDVMISINIEIDRRLDALEAAGVVKIQDYTGHMPYIVLVIDEAAELNDKEVQKYLNRITRLGRAAGVVVALATQRPSSSIFDKSSFGDTKAMFSATMAFHCRDGTNSRILLDNERAAMLPKKKPGRAIYQWESEFEVQTMHLPVQRSTALLKDVNIKKVNLDGDEPPARLPAR